MTAPWTPLLHTLAALAGSSLAGVIVGALVAYVVQQRGAARADKRALRDAKIKRLEDAYVATARAALQLWRAWRALYPFDLEGETKEDARGRRAELADHSAKLQASQAPLTDALIILRLRSDTLAVAELAAAFGQAADRYKQLAVPYALSKPMLYGELTPLQTLSVGLFSRPPERQLASSDDILTALKQLDAAYDQLLGAMRASIESAERPI